MVYSGMGPDFRVLVAKARKSAQAYWKVYGEYPSVKVLVQEVATVMQEATQSGSVQPPPSFLLPRNSFSSLYLVQRSTTVRRFPPRRRLRQDERTFPLPDRSLGFLLALESDRYRKESRQRKDLPRKTVSPRSRLTSSRPRSSSSLYHRSTISRYHQPRNHTDPLRVDITKPSH